MEKLVPLYKTKLGPCGLPSLKHTQRLKYWSFHQLVKLASIKKQFEIKQCRGNVSFSITPDSVYNLPFFSTLAIRAARGSLLLSHGIMGKCSLETKLKTIYKVQFHYNKNEFHVLSWELCHHLPQSFYKKITF